MYIFFLSQAKRVTFINVIYIYILNYFINRFHFFKSRYVFAYYFVLYKNSSKYVSRFQYIVSLTILGLVHDNHIIIYNGGICSS